jgi:glycopeptide antibiotics resistance protein
VHNIFLKPTIILFCIAIPAYIIARAALRKKTAGIDISVGRELLYFTFFVYLIGLISVTIVPLTYSLHAANKSSNLNLVPVTNIIYSIRHMMQQHFRWGLLFQNTPGNVLLFVPFGLLLPLISKKWRPFYRIFLLGMFCSAAIEGIQYLEKNVGVYRSVDIDDVILNTLGTALGWLLFRLIKFITNIQAGSSS